MALDHRPHRRQGLDTYSVAFLDPALNATVRVRPGQCFGLVQDDFSGWPTRWRFLSARSDARPATEKKSGAPAA